MSLLPEDALIDGGVPRIAERCGLGERYHYWQGFSGRRYLFTAIEAEQLGDFRNVVIIIARRDSSGLSGLEIVAPGDPGEPDIERIACRLNRYPGLQAFVHLLARDHGDRRMMMSDILGDSDRIAA